MADLQVVHLRETVPFRDVGAVAVLSLPMPVVDGTLTAVAVDGVPTAYIVNNRGRLLVSFPAANTKREGWAVSLTVLDAVGNTTVVPYAEHEAPQLLALLRVVVDNAAKVEEVWVNKQSALFARITDRALLCELPQGTASLDTLEIISQAPSVQRISLFAYVLPTEARMVSGPQKIVAQYVKLLQTTAGSDVLHPSEGGGLQNIIGVTNVTTSGDTTLAARVMRAIDSTTSAILTGQQGLQLPMDEKLLSASVGQIGSNPTDPTVISVTLRIETFAKQSAFFNMFFGPGLAKLFS
jgi:hypothetical protein